MAEAPRDWVRVHTKEAFSNNTPASGGECLRKEGYENAYLWDVALTSLKLIPRANTAQVRR